MVSFNVKHNGDIVAKGVCRVPVNAKGYQWVRYKGRRYQLFGGIRTDFCINLNIPFKTRKEIKHERRA